MRNGRAPCDYNAPVADDVELEADLGPRPLLVRAWDLAYRVRDALRIPFLLLEDMGTVIDALGALSTELERLRDEAVTNAATVNEANRGTHSRLDALRSAQRAAAPVSPIIDPDVSHGWNVRIQKVERTVLDMKETIERWMRAQGMPERERLREALERTERHLTTERDAVARLAEELRAVRDAGRVAAEAANREIALRRENSERMGAEINALREGMAAEREEVAASHAAIQRLMQEVRDLRGDTVKDEDA
jgi:hypothetical protein